ncbi:MAG: TetR/AcrR family transcriptional regulator [Stomatobaculum sp.]
MRRELTLRQRRIMIYFVEATQQLIQAEGLEKLTIRKIAAKAGYNSATLYNYFSDLNHLVLFGSVCYLREYVEELTKSLRPEMNALESFRTIYRCFNDIAFRYPHIFHNLFYGKHSTDLGNVLECYYHELFPEELRGLSPRMREMLVYGTMSERDSVSVGAMVAEGFLAADKADITKSLIIDVHQTFLYEAAIRGEGLDLKAHRAQFERLFEYVLEQGRAK